MSFINLPNMMYNMSYSQHQLVYNFTSFTLASMMATTAFLWLRLPSIAEKYKTALCITGLVRAPAPIHKPLSFSVGFAPACCICMHLRSLPNFLCPTLPTRYPTRGAGDLHRFLPLRPHLQLVG